MRAKWQNDKLSARSRATRYQYLFIIVSHSFPSHYYQNQLPHLTSRFIPSEIFPSSLANSIHARLSVRAQHEVLYPSPTTRQTVQADNQLPYIVESNQQTSIAQYHQSSGVFRASKARSGIRGKSQDSGKAKGARSLVPISGTVDQLVEIGAIISRVEKIRRKKGQSVHTGVQVHRVVYI